MDFIEKSFPELKKAWLKIEKNQAQSYNATYEWQKTMLEYTNKNVLRTFLFHKTRFYAVTDHGEVKIIVPVVFSKDGVEIYGKKSCSDYFDFIYEKDVEQKYIEFAIENLFKLKNVNKIIFPGLNVESATYSVVSSREKSKTVETERPSCKILLSDYDYSFDEYFRGLSKHHKQNIRTAYNRMSTDEKKFAFQIYDGKTIGNDLAEELIKLHQIRLEDKYSYKKVGFINSTLYLMLKKFTNGKYGKDAVIFNMMTKSPQSYVALIKIDDEIAAFYYGVKYNGGGYATISFPRVCVNEKFGKYSPGMLLGTEIIKDFCNKKYDVFDLTSGDEKYKLRLGCKVETDKAITVLK